MTARFPVGAAVRVRRAFPPGHVRTPWFIRGQSGVISQIAGCYPNPEELAYGRSGKPELALYRVRFALAAVWPDYTGAALDTLVLDIYEHWLEPVEESNP